MKLWEKEKPEDKYEWPNCAPIDKSDEHWKFNNNCNINGVSYHKVEVSPGRWQWQVNEEAERQAREYQKRRDDLVWALRTRPLTDEEFAQVRAEDYHLLVRPMQPYYEEEVKREFNEALLRQYQMREAARKTP